MQVASNRDTFSQPAAINVALSSLNPFILLLLQDCVGDKKYSSLCIRFLGFACV